MKTKEDVWDEIGKVLTKKKYRRELNQWLHKLYVAGDDLRSVLMCDDNPYVREQIDKLMKLINEPPRYG